MATFARAGYNAVNYERFRPRYLPSLYLKLMDYHIGPCQQALDVGTGTGQVARELVQYFKSMRATDPSAVMLSGATPYPRVTYACEPAEQITGEDGSVDMVTAAQSAHWFRWPEFLASAHRVLRPDGTLAVWGYAMPVFPQQPALTEACQQLSYQIFDDCWEPGRRCVENYYADLPIPAEPTEGDAEAAWWGVERHIWQTINNDSPDSVFDKSAFMPLLSLSWAELAAYLRTWSAYTTWKQREEVRRREMSQRGGAPTMDDALEINDPVDETLAWAQARMPSVPDTVDMTWGHVLLLARRT